MAKFKNSRTGRVVEVPDRAPGIEKIKGRDERDTKVLREIRQKKYDRTVAKMKASERWGSAPSNAKAN